MLNCSQCSSFSSCKSSSDHTPLCRSCSAQNIRSQVLSGTKYNISILIDPSSSSKNNLLLGKSQSRPLSLYKAIPAIKIPEGSFPITSDPFPLLYSQFNLITEGHSKTINDSAISNDNCFIVTGSTDTTVRVWNLQELKQEAVLTGHMESVKTVAISKDGKIVASGSDDRNVIIWDWVERVKLSVFGDHGGSVWYVLFTYDENFIVSASVDKCVRVWNLRSKGLEFIIKHNKWLHGIAVTEDNKYVVSWFGIGQVKIWNIKEKIQLYETTTPLVSLDKVIRADQSLKELKHVFDFMVFGEKPNGCYWLGTSRNNYKISPPCSNFMNMIEDLKVLKSTSFSLHKPNFDHITLSRDGNLGVFACQDNTILVWNFPEGVQEAEFSYHTGKITCIASSNNKKFFVTGSTDTTVRIWDLFTAQQIAVFKGHKDTIRCIEVDKKHENIVTGAEDTTIRVWNIKEKRQEAILKGHRKTVTCLKVTNDCNFVVSGSEDWTVRIWNILTKTQESILIGHEYFVHNLILTNDNMFAVTVGGDFTARMWDLEMKSQVSVVKHLISRIGTFNVTGNYKYYIIESSKTSVIVYKCLSKGVRERYNHQGWGDMIFRNEFYKHCLLW